MPSAAISPRWRFLIKLDFLFEDYLPSPQIINIKNAINWFEIPVKDFVRAKKFYESVLAATMLPMEGMGMKSAFFPADLENGIGGCIIEGPDYIPSDKGSLVYLNGGEDLGIVLSKVEPAGGKIRLPKTGIGPNGFMALFTDTEGNKIGLHSPK